MSITIIPDCKCKPVIAELLAALEALLNGGYLIPYASDTDEDIRLKNQARAAIAKAAKVRP